MRRSAMLNAVKWNLPRFQSHMNLNILATNLVNCCFQERWYHCTTSLQQKSKTRAKSILVSALQYMTEHVDSGDAS